VILFTFNEILVDSEAATNIISTASAKTILLPIHTTRMWIARQANGTIQKLDEWVRVFISDRRNNGWSSDCLGRI
jgi:hypothetical protein